MSGREAAYLVDAAAMRQGRLSEELAGLAAASLHPRIFVRGRTPRAMDEASLPGVEHLPGLRELDPWTLLFATERQGATLLESVRRVVAESGDWLHASFPSVLAEALHLIRRCAELGIAHLHVHFTVECALLAQLVARLGGPSFSLTISLDALDREEADPGLLARIATSARWAIVRDEDEERVVLRLLRGSAGTSPACRRLDPEHDDEAGPRLADWLREEAAGEAGPPVGKARQSPRPRRSASPARVALFARRPAMASGFERQGRETRLAAVADAFEKAGAEVSRFDDDDVGSWPDALDRRGPFELLYELYELGRPSLAEWARRHEVPLVVDVDSPLARLRRGGGGRDESPRAREHDAERFAAASRVIAVSSVVAAYAVARGADAARVRVLPSGVDTSIFRPRPSGDELRRTLVPGGRVAVGFHGTLDAHSGIETVADAVGRLVRAGLPVQLVLVGRGALESLVDRRVPSGSVTRVGWVEHAEVARYVAAFDLLALGYGAEMSWVSPLQLAEAMACGVVPVVPKLGDLTEVVTHGENGLVYAAGSAEGLAAALRRLVENDSMRGRMSTRVPARARALSWTRVAEAALEVARERRSTAVEVTA